ncbi:MAG: S8 family serine peptidase [Verrucomicrobiota bacterium]
MNRLKATSILSRASGLAADGVLRERTVLTVEGRYPRVVMTREYVTGSSGGSPAHGREYAYVADHLLLGVSGKQEVVLQDRLRQLGWSAAERIGDSGLYRLPLSGDPMTAVDDALRVVQADPVLAGFVAEPDFLVTTGEVFGSGTAVAADESGKMLIDPVSQDWVRGFDANPVSTYGPEAVRDQAKSLLTSAPAGARVLQFEAPNAPNSFRPGTRLQNFFIRTQMVSDSSSVYIQTAYTSGYPLNGSYYVRVLSSDGGLVFSHKDNLPFQVHQIDLAEYSSVYRYPKSVAFTGYRADGTTVTTSFTTDGVMDGTGPLNDFQTFSFPNTFQNLVKLVAANPPYMIDNIVVTLEGQETPLPPDPSLPVIYDVDWNDEDSTVDAAPPVSGPYAISSVNFGSPKVRASLGALTDRPLELIGGGSGTGYSQLRFDLLRGAESYVVEFDLLQVDQSKSTTLFFDCVSGLVRVDFSSNSITVMNSSGSYSYSSDIVNRVRAVYTPATSRLELSLNGTPLISTVPRAASGDARAMRISVTDSNGSGGVGIDNLRIEAHASAEPPVSAPRLVLYPATLLTFPNSTVGGSVTRMVTLKNAGTADLHVSSITSDQLDFVPKQAVVPPVPPGGIYYCEVMFRPTTGGVRTGKLHIVSDALEGNDVQLNLTGVATGVPGASLTPVLLDASIVAGTRGTENFSIRNIGGAPLEWRLVRVEGPDAEPPPAVNTNDSSSGALWGLDSGDTGGIEARRAWNVSTGDPALMVAVIDTGVDIAHPDLAANLAVNPGEIPGNGVDDDGNGYADDVRGWDFVENKPAQADPHGHGTHVAGTIAAVGDNAFGVVGVAWGAKILPVRFLSATGVGYTSDAIQAVDYARKRGARLINASWGGGGYSTLLQNAISQHVTGTRGLFVAAAGNSATNNDADPFYPSSYAVPGIVSVAASTPDNRLASFSNYGRFSVDVAAPGLDILSCYRAGGFAYMSGTSMAAPHVSGALALIHAWNPHLAGEDYRALLLGNVDFPGALNGQVASDGRINVWRALTRTTQSWLAPDLTYGITSAGGSTLVPLQIDATGLSPGYYESNLAFQTNDPVRPKITLPVRLRVEPGTAYHNWTRQVFAENELLHTGAADMWSADADPDTDGVPNLLEFVLGRSATAREAGVPLSVQRDDNGRPYAAFDLAASLEGAVWLVESSSTLQAGSWSSADIEITEVSRDPESGTRHMIAALKADVSHPQRIFFRLRAYPE